MAARHAGTLGRGIVYAAGNVARRGLHVLLLPVYTATLPPDALGVLALLTVTGRVLTLLLVTPLVTGALERFYYHPHWRRLRPVLAFNIAVVLGLCAAAAAGIWLAAAGPIGRWLLPAAAGVRPVALVRLYALVVLLWPLELLGLCFLKLLGRAGRTVAVSLAEAGVAAAVIVTGLLTGFGLAAVVAGTAAGMAVAVALSAPTLLAHCRARAAPRVLRRPLGVGLPMLPVGLSRLAMHLGDRYVLRAFLPAGRIGVYDVSYRLSEAIDTAVGTPAHDAAHPAIRRLEAEPARQRRFIRRWALLAYGLALGAALGLALLAREVLMLVAFANPAYWDGWVVLPLVAFGFAQQALGAFLDWGLIMTNRTGLLSGVLAVSAAANILLNVLLIPPLGILGAALATAVSYTLWNVLRGAFSWRLYRLAVPVGRLVALTLLAGGLYAASLLLGPLALSLPAGVGVKLVLWAAFVPLAWGVLSRGERRRARIALTRLARRRR